jgi:hypothetical protein
VTKTNVFQLSQPTPLDHNLHHSDFWPKHVMIDCCGSLCGQKYANGHAAHRARLAAMA